MLIRIQKSQINELHEYFFNRKNESINEKKLFNLNLK